MKKLIVAALAVIVFGTINETKAQQGFSISVKGTPSATWMNNKNDRDNKIADFNPLFGTSFGVGAGYNFNQNIGVETDVLYSLQGRRYEIAGIENNQRVNYIKVAPMFTYTIPTRGFVSFVGKVGPQLSILTDSKITNDDGDAIHKNMNDRYKDVTFGGVANLGVQFRLANKVFLTTGLRYDLDFTNAENKNHSEYTSGRKTTTNSTAGLEVGLKYKL